MRQRNLCSYGSTSALDPNVEPFRPRETAAVKAEETMRKIITVVEDDQ